MIKKTGTTVDGPPVPVELPDPDAVAELCAPVVSLVEPPFVAVLAEDAVAPPEPLESPHAGPESAPAAATATTHSNAFCGGRRLIV